jgi:GT2 family glycosyltransferase
MRFKLFSFCSFNPGKAKPNIYPTSMKIIAVIVTHNRLSLLKKCLAAVNAQTRKPDDIIVINNGSTDDTQLWLSGQQVITYTQGNEGGAGGFSYGINMAYRHRADWIWLMDDDTIPHLDALEQLETALNKVGKNQDKVGFLSSSVHWTDGKTHEMNQTYLLEDKKKLADFSFAAEAGLPLIQFGTFVSMLLSAKAVEKVGLPIKEYFIWCDDVEFSKRIINSGMAGLAVKNSLITHETPTNHQSSVFIDPHSSIWKFGYGLRNELFTKRLHEGERHFWTSWVHRMFIMPFRIVLNRKSHRWDFIKVIWKTSLKAISFRPMIEKVDSLT